MKNKDLAASDESHQASTTDNLDELFDKLKPHGGRWILPMPETKEHLELLLKAGHIFNTTKFKLVAGEPNRCHTNAGRLWAENEQLQLVVGYVLWEGCDIWMQHSWVWNPQTGELMDSMGPGAKYFGVGLTERQSYRHAIFNVPEFKNVTKVTPRLMALSLVMVAETIKDIKEKDKDGTLMSELRKQLGFGET